MIDNPHFEIAPDASRKFLRVRMAGHWDQQTVDLYEKALLDAVKQMGLQGCPARDVLTLVDARNLNAQSQDVLATYKEAFERADRQMRPRRLAIIVSSALFKRQVLRLVVADQRIFASEEDALEWLFSSVSSDG